MDNGFPILDAFNDDQAFERHFGSFLDDASNQLPDLDSAVLDDGDPGTGENGLDALDQGLFDTGVVDSHGAGGYSSLPSPGGPMLGGVLKTSGGGYMSHDPAPQSPYGSQPSPASVPPPPSPAQHQFTAPSPAPPQSPAHLQMRSPAPSPANILYTAKSPASALPPPSPRGSQSAPPVSPQPQILQTSVASANSMVSWPPLISNPGLVPAGSTVLTQPIGTQSGQMIQLQLQPSVSVQSLSSTNSPQGTKLQPITTPTVPLTPNKSGLKQPQLLPKPSSVSQQPVTRAQVTPNKSLVSLAGPSIAQSLVTTPTIPPGPGVQTITAHAQPGQPQVIMGQVTGQPQVATGQPQVIMGQYVQQAGGQPMLIQQPGSSNMMIIRPGTQTVQATPTLVPVNGLGGQFIVQQPNVKLITPQGRMQMQKIQTPSGPQLIAVPLAAAQPTFIQGSPGQLLTTAPAPGGAIITGLPGHQALQLPSGQIQLQAAPNIALSSAPIIAGSMASTGSGFTTLQSSGQLLTAPPGAIVSLGQSPLTSVASVVTVPSLGALQGSVITQQSVIQPPAAPVTSSVGPALTSSPISPTKRKKPKKKRKDEDLLSNKSQGAVDLGALMKDVGLLDFGSDDFGFGMDNSQQGSSQNLNNSLNSSQNSSSSDIEADLSNIVTNPPPDLSMASQPSSIPLNIAQISAQPPQLPLQPQFSASVAPVTPSLRLGAPASVVTSQPQSQPLQLVQGPDGNFILQTTNSVTGIIGGQPQEIAASGNLISTAVSTIPQTPSTSSIVTPAKSSPKPPQRSRNIADANRTPLFDDETLPSGWKRKVSQRKSGASAGRYEVFIIGPSGKRFRSRNELKSFFEKTGENTLNPDDFDFSTFGRNNPIQQKGPVVHATSPVATPQSSEVRVTTAPVTSSVIVTSVASLVTSAMPSVVTSVSPASSTAGPGPGLSESELIKNLENSAMASVAAARALEVGEQGLGMRNTLLQSIQQPLPPASLSHGQPGTAGPASAAVTTAEQLLGATKPPPPPLTLPPPSPGGQSKHHPPTPLSADMEDAESQITQLLESLQKQQGGASVNSDQEFFDSLTSSQAQNTPSSKTEPFSKPSRFPSPQMPTLTPQMPVLTPQVSESPQKPQDLQNRVKQIVEKRRSRHESGGMPMLSPTTGFLHPASSPGAASGVSPVSPRANTKTGGVIQAVPKYSEAPAMSSGPPNVTVQSPASVSSAASGPGMGGAGSGSQLRALQQLPPNTRLQHGPNGQIMVQKIQTIELSPTMQQQYKILAQKISLIEQKAVKSPQDEADLAELQAKQHQILSTGRPVFGHQQQQPTAQQPLPQHPAPLQPNVIAPSAGPLTSLVPAPPHPQPRLAPLAPVVRPPPGPGPGPSPAGVPPLTEQQRRIVAEFKTKIAKLPPQEQAAYIAQNKMTLIRQLDFKPNQLKILQTNQPGPGPPPPTHPPVPIIPASGPLVPPGGPVMLDQMIRPSPLVRPGAARPLILQPNIGLLRPVPPVINNVDSAVRNNLPTIDRNKKIAWIESQLRNDQKEATQPNYKTPFRSREDTVKRLLRYHVYYEPITSDQEMREAEEEFERTSERLLERYQVNLSKYHLLMLDESMRLCSSSCEAMLGRMWVAEEKAALAREKEEYRAKFNRLLELDRREEPLGWDERAEQARLARWVERPDMPALPESWAERYERVVGRTWASYKQQFPREAHTEQPESEPGSPEPEPEIEPEPEKPVEEEEEDIDIKSEPQDQESDADSFFRERHASTNSDMFSDRCRSRNSSSGTVSSRTQLKINLPIEPSQLRNEFNDLSQQASKAEQSLRPQSSDSEKTFVGLKFNRMGSGRWSASLKRDAAEAGEFSQHHKRRKLDRDFEDDSSDDEDFSLADVGGDNAAVQSMLENDDDDDDLDDDQDDLDHVEDELRFVNNPSRLSLDTFDPRYNLSPGVLTSADSRDNESVTNAIHSILEYDRGAVQTPEDLKNLTGLLDSDSATQNAVNSIL